MGPPKAKEKDISRRNFYSLFSPGFEPGTSHRGRKSRRREDSKLLVFFSVASEMTNQFILARTMNQEVFLPALFKSPWSRGRSFAQGARGPGFKSRRKYGNWSKFQKSPRETFGSLVFGGPKWVLFDPLKSFQNFIQLQLLMQ